MVQTAPKPGKTTEEELASRIATAQAEATELVKAKWRNMAIEQRWDLGVTLFGLTTAAIVISPASGLLQSGYRSLAALPQKVEQAKEAASETVEEVKTGAINFGLIGGRFKGTPPKGEKIAGYTVTSSWGPRNIPNGSRYHRGVDLATHVGVEVRAVGLPGEEVEVRCFKDFTKGGGVVASFKSHKLGKTIEYLHLNNCKSGKAKAGEVVGKTGQSARTMTDGQPHLHFQQRNESGVKEKPWRGLMWAALTGNLPVKQFESTGER